MINRKKFIKKICLSGACMCGFAAIASATGIEQLSTVSIQEPDNNQLMLLEWTANLLRTMGASNSEEVAQIIKSNGIVHYNFLKMEAILEEFGNDLEKFVHFLETSWGWKITHNLNEKTLIADENKSSCVCPIAGKLNQRLPALCNCSEGIAELMFTKVLGKTAKARVIASIQRGDETCKYEIIWN
jgi:hypothetical protein